MVTNKPGSPRRARRKPLKPLRREGREFRRTCGDYARVLFHFCTQGCGCVRRARLSLRPPFSGGKCRCQSRTQSAPRDHERIPEIGSTAFPVGKGSDKIAYVSQGLPMQTPREILADLWILAGGEPAALNSVALTGEEPQLPSSFRVAAAAQTSIAAAGLAAAQLWKLRSGKDQNVAVEIRHAVVECRSERYLGVEGTPPPPAWDAIAGVYKTRDRSFCSSAHQLSASPRRGVPRPRLQGGAQRGSGRVDAMGCEILRDRSLCRRRRGGDDAFP